MKEFRLYTDFVFPAQNEKDALLRLSKYFLALYEENESQENDLGMIVGELELNEYIKE